MMPDIAVSYQQLVLAIYGIPWGKSGKDPYGYANADNFKVFHGETSSEAKKVLNTLVDVASFKHMANIKMVKRLVVLKNKIDSIRNVDQVISWLDKLTNVLYMDKETNQYDGSLFLVSFKTPKKN